MANDWIIDVLEDLTAFARANGLQSLEMQLGITSHVAAAEIATSQGMSPSIAGNGGHVGRELREIERSAGLR